MEPKQPALQIFALLILLLSLAACHKGSDAPCEGADMTPVTYPITAEDEAKIKYQGHDTLRFQMFIDSVLIDTVTFIGQGRVYDTIFLGSRPPSTCIPDEYAQYFSILYKADKPGLNFSYIIKAGPGSSKFTIKFQNLEVGDNMARVNWTLYTGYYGQLQVNGKFYDQVNLFVSQDTDQNFRVYYTVKDGIIRMELFHNQVWQLID